MSLPSLSNSVSINSTLTSTNINPKPLHEANSKIQSEEVQSGSAISTKREQQTSKVDVEKAVKTLNEFTGMVAQDVLFSMDEESGKTIVKVVDSQTKEVLRQLPSAEALAIAKSLEKMQGLLIHEKA